MAHCWALAVPSYPQKQPIRAPRETVVLTPPPLRSPAYPHRKGWGELPLLAERALQLKVVPLLSTLLPPYNTQLEEQGGRGKKPWSCLEGGGRGIALQPPSPWPGMGGVKNPVGAEMRLEAGWAGPVVLKPWPNQRTTVAYVTSLGPYR